MTKRATTSGSGGARRRPAAAPARYHHGALPEALLAAAERILARDGIQGLALRAIAREAGVSHTAPQHHFGDMSGVLSELAAIGFARLRACLLADVDKVAPGARGAAIGRGYIAFARAHPGLFQLMFRSERLDMTRPALRKAADEAFAVLEQTGAASAFAGAGAPLQRAAAIAARWSLVHGLAFLLIDGRLDPVLGWLGQEANEDDLIEATLASVRVQAKTA